MTVLTEAENLSINQLKSIMNPSLLGTVENPVKIAKKHGTLS